MQRNWHYYLGVLLTIALAAIAVCLAKIPFITTLHLSPLIIGIVLGLILANTIRSRLPEGMTPGLKFVGKRILRLAIVFYGFRLTLSDVWAAGWATLLVDTIVVSSTLLLGAMVGRWLRLDRETSMLTSAGSAVCGAAAVLASEPVVGANSAKTVVAVSTVVLFGTLSMFLYPVLYQLGVYHMSDAQVAVYTGSTLHEVAHVAGAGAAMQATSVASTFDIAGTATITKMIRVILLAPVLIVLGLFFQRGNKGETRATKRIAIPWFAVWFLIIIGLNTLLLSLASTYGLEDTYASVRGIIRWVDDVMLTMAMAAIGTDAVFARFREAGFKPFALAAVLYIWLTVGGYFLIKLIV